MKSSMFTLRTGSTVGRWTGCRTRWRSTTGWPANGSDCLPVANLLSRVQARTCGPPSLCRETFSPRPEIAADKTRYGYFFLICTSRRCCYTTPEHGGGVLAVCSPRILRSQLGSMRCSPRTAGDLSVVNGHKRSRAVLFEITWGGLDKSLGLKIKQRMVFFHRG